jgi:hypothetical protein
MFCVMEDFDVRHASILQPLVANPATGIVVFLICGRIERRDSQSQSCSSRDSPRHPKELKGNLDDLIGLQEFPLEEAVAKPRPPYVFSQMNR